MTASQQHATVATRSENPAPLTPESYRCGRPEDGSVLAPCWDVETEVEHARAAHALGAPTVGARLAACQGIPDHELTHSPLAHGKEIIEVIPQRSIDGSIEGVRVMFRLIPGLTADWMRQAIACHRARHESLGRPESYLANDPTLVEGAEVTVTQTKTVLQVHITTPSPQAGRIAWERANALAYPQAARR